MTSSNVGSMLIRVQIVPHITNAIQDWIERVSKIPVDDTGEEPDVCIVEVCVMSGSRDESCHQYCV